MAGPYTQLGITLLARCSYRTPPPRRPAASRSLACAHRVSASLSQACSVLQTQQAALLHRSCSQFYLPHVLSRALSASVCVHNSTVFIRSFRFQCGFFDRINNGTRRSISRHPRSMSVSEREINGGTYESQRVTDRQRGSLAQSAAGSLGGYLRDTAVMDADRRQSPSGTVR